MNMYCNSSTHKSELGVNTQHAAPQLETCLPQGLSRLFAEKHQEPLHRQQQQQVQAMHYPSYTPRTGCSQPFPRPGLLSFPLRAVL